MSRKNDPDWLISAKPMLKELCKDLKIVLPSLVPGAAMAMKDYDTIAGDLKFMEGLARSLDALDQHELRHEHERPFQRAEGADLRWLRLLEKLDPKHHWGGLTPTATPEGEVLWLCEEHRKLYR